MAVSFPIIWIKTKHSIPAGATVIVDTEELGKFISIDYDMSFKNTDQTKVKNLKLKVTADDSSVRSQVYNRARIMNIAVNDLVVGSDYQLQVTNNEAFDVDLILAKLKL